MKALIIYRDFISAVQANHLLLNSASNPAVNVLWNVRPWRVDMLRFPPVANEALTDAQDAHIIIFAGGCAQVFPFWLQDWLELWAQSRQVADPVLAAICPTAADQKAVAAIGASDNMNQFAARHGLRVIFDESGGMVFGSGRSVERLNELRPLNVKSEGNAPGTDSTNSNRQEPL